MYVDVLVEIGIKKLDNVFTYFVPSDLSNFIKIGIRVSVPFGNRKLEGFIMSIYHDKKDTDYEIKDIISVIDETEVLNKEMLWLGKEISKLTLCSLISSYQAMLPKALKARSKVNMKTSYKRYLVLNKDGYSINKFIETNRFEKQNIILEELLITDRMLLTRMDSSIKTLLNKGLIKIEEVEEYRYIDINDKKYDNINLNKEQESVVNSVVSKINENITYLLHGITGSGKTEVYIRIIENVIKNGREAIMLVPEISLTPQIIGRFKNKFGDDIAILHSGLTDSERYDEYRKIRNNMVHIVIGARSAIFAPLTNLGIIIIDEEHSNTYKQDNHPRYNTKDIAILRSTYHKCPVILGSATPTLDSYARSKKGVYQLLELPSRANNKKLPNITIIDMKEEMKKGNSIFSSLLFKKIIDTINKKEQVILFLNRRGYSSMITCTNCGYVAKCPKCDISLTYHKTSNTLRCHYCGYGLIRTTNCPECHSPDFKEYGLGTERLEEELHKLLPETRIIRMDNDTTSKRGSHKKIINDFEDGKYDILIGTQMIAKGLDFPKVTLVGIINADTALNIPDFRSSERTFNLLCQVGGRAGRSTSEGEVIIQTFNPDHYAIKYAANHDYIGFYNEEMNIRHKLKYPPYYFVILVQIKSTDYKLCSSEATKVSKYLRSKLNSDTIILGPTTANMFKMNNVYHFQCIIKYKKDVNLIPTLIEIDNIYKTKNNVTIEIDTMLN